MNGGTKHLQQFLHCTKEYRTTGLLGTATTSYDCKEPVMRRAPYTHVTRELVVSKLPLFTGNVKQLPPLFSALRMDGKRLFEYAREGVPLPRPIEPRDVTVHELRLVEWLAPDAHSYKAPDTEVSDEEKALLGQVRRLAGSSDEGLDTTRSREQPPTGDRAAEAPDVGAQAPMCEKQAEVLEQAVPTAPATETHSAGTPDDSLPAAFALEMTVSSGTYVRSIVHDLGTACGSAAHVVRLIRTRQGAFSLGHEAEQGNCIPWSVFERGLAELDAAHRGDTSLDSRDASGLREWERAVLAHFQTV